MVIIFRRIINKWTTKSALTPMPIEIKINRITFLFSNSDSFTTI